MGEDSSATCPSVYIERTLKYTCTAKNIVRSKAHLSKIHMGLINIGGGTLVYIERTLKYLHLHLYSTLVTLLENKIIRDE